MTTLTLIYDYVPSRGQWKIIDLRDAHGASQPLPKPLSYTWKIGDLPGLLQKDYPPEKYAVVLERYCPCYEQQHSLAHAEFAYWSIDKKLAYLRCSCGKQRQVKRDELLEAWGAKEVPQ